mgnify:CR=1 FL=1
MRVALLAFGLTLGCGTPEYRACENICKELVRNCSYDAFPTTESCMLGCADELANGADVFEQEDCVLDAECDTFAIVECHNSFGSDS